MRWGLIPRWWSKTVKDAKMVTFNARAETIETKPFFRDAFKRTRCLIPMSGYYEWQDASDVEAPATLEIVPSPVIDTNDEFFFGTGDRSAGYYAERPNQ
jgi:putative SOS response-associated peptidase YedK